MPALIDIRRRIRSVKNTQQITKALKMVSAAKLRRAQESMFAARPYARTMAVDFKTGTVYLATAEGTVDPAKKWKTEVSPFYPNKYFKDTFVLLAYSRR